MKNILLRKVRNTGNLALIGAVLLISTTLAYGSHTIPSLTLLPDSIGVENVNGKQVILHKLMPKETYYGISRRYQVPLDELITFNNNKSLKIGDNVRVPTSRPAQTAASPQARSQTRTQIPTQNQTQTPAQNKPAVQLKPSEYTEYIVGKGETLYAVSTRFQVPIESIKLANGLVSDQLQTDMVLKVPHKAINTNPTATFPTATTADARSIDDVMEASVGIDHAQKQAESDYEIKKNRYGMREVLEKGIGVAMEDLASDGSNMLVLHKNAAIGTIVKITNPMTGHSTFAKVVGKFVDSAETQGAIIVISKSVASVIGLLDKRFQIEIAYGAVSES